MRKKSMHSQFKVLIESDEDGFFVASVPLLPGCHTQAKTLPELMKRIRDAIQLCLEISRTDIKYRAKIRQFAYEPTFVGMEVVTL